MFGCETRLAPRVFDKNRKLHAIDRRHALAHHSPDFYVSLGCEVISPLENSGMTLLIEQKVADD
jgi:hypothetical protein